MSEPSEIRVNLPFRGRQLAEFLAIKEHLGVQTNADVVRYLVHSHARLLRRRKKILTQRRQGARSQGEGEKVTQRRREAEAQREGERGRPTAVGETEAQGENAGRGAGRAPAEQLCLDCPLPECDEGNPRCPYQRATGERERQRDRTRAYMRRARAQ